MPRNLPELSANESKVYDELRRRGYPSQSKDLGRTCFGRGRKLEQAHSWARNSLRGLMRKGLVKQIARGVYQS